MNGLSLIFMLCFAENTKPAIQTSAVRTCESRSEIGGQLIFCKGNLLMHKKITLPNNVEVDISTWASF